MSINDANKHDERPRASKIRTDRITREAAAVKNCVECRAIIEKSAIHCPHCNRIQPWRESK